MPFQSKEGHNGEAVSTFGVYRTQRHSESRAFLSAVEQEVTKLTLSETPSSLANPFSSSRYSTFSLRRLSKPPEETKPHKQNEHYAQTN